MRMFENPLLSIKETGARSVDYYSDVSVGPSDTNVYTLDVWLHN